jgi:hypothetical protein
MRDSPRTRIPPASVAPVLEQRRGADPRLATDDQDSAHAGQRSIQLVLDGRALVGAVKEAPGESEMEFSD